MKLLTMSMVALFTSLNLYADETPDQVAAWTVKELQMAQSSALTLFKTKQGTAKYDSISGFSVEKSSQGNAGKVRIQFEDSGKHMTALYFCHEHEKEEIDCHQKTISENSHGGDHSSTQGDLAAMP